MRARDGVEEDLSAYAREDLVYKAKLAEQAERCARIDREECTHEAKERDGRRSGTGGSLVDDRARRVDANERERTRANTRETIERAIDRARDESIRFDSDRFDSIERSIERTKEERRSNERSIDA
jgi:hypothetical protein